MVRRLRTKLSRQLTSSQKTKLLRFRDGDYGWQESARKVGSAAVPLLRRRADSGVPITRGFDARQEVFEAVDQIRRLLSSRSVEYVELPRSSSYRPHIAIREDDTRLVWDALTQLRGSGWDMLAINGTRSKMRWESVEKNLSEVRQFVCRRRVVSSGGLELSTADHSITIEPWQSLDGGTERVDGSFHIEGTLHRRLDKPRTWVEYFTPDEWTRAVRNENHVPLDFDHIFSVSGPVDIVYTWVDGSDPTWQAKKNSYASEAQVQKLNDSAASSSRYYNRDELKYSLRSVEYYASWVNHIYLVTDGQVPSWLDTEHPKLTVVDHKEIFTDTSVLPVFNSHAIESQLHHIENLQEKYIYMNDDVFFLRPTDPELFFTGNGLSKFFPSAAPLDISGTSSRDMPVLSAAKNGRDLIECEFERTVTNKFKHTPHPQLRTILEEMEGKYSSKFEAVSQSKFRHPEDVSIASSLHHYYAYSCGRAIDAHLPYAYCDLGRADLELYLHRLFRRADVDLMCLNDTKEDSPLEPAERERLIHEFLEKRFPAKSTFEKWNS